MSVAPLDVEALCRRCDGESFTFETTDDLEDLEEILGQSRALEAIRFGAKIDRRGYNLFVFGPQGTGRHSTVTRILKEKAAGEETPSDWVYVNNFVTPHKPKAIRMPPGQGAALRDALRNLIEEIRTSVPATFESEDYRNRLQAIEEAAQEKQASAFEALREKAQEKSIALVRTPMGFALAPMKDGAVIEPEAFNALPAEVRQRIQAEIEALQSDLEAIIRRMPRLARERQEAIRELNREVIVFTVAHPIEQLRETFAALPDVLEHLDAVQTDLVENIHQILHSQMAQQQAPLGESPGALAAQRASGFGRYEANLIVGGDDHAGAPVVYEDNPAVDNLIGRVEHVSQLGALITDFTLIKPGALHRANGGYLIIDARKVLTQPLAWETLKRNLKAGEITIESLGQMLSLVSTVSLEPQAIPLSVKVVLCGEPLIYYLLSQLDPEFRLLFKVAADFDDAMDRDDGGDQNFARMIATMGRREKLRPLDRGAVARVIEQASRLAEDAEKISIDLERISDLLREADFYAGEDGADVVSRAHVQQAVEAQIRRADRLRERSQEAITRNIILVDTDGAAVGRINGLSVLQLSGFAFGRPTRITARVRLGSGKVIDIEREVELGGPLHSKGVLILSGYLASRYALDKPLSLSASLVFEQSYGGVDGDSASSAELYALLSALAEVPIKQNFAVTGSVNQLGQIQAIGGVNEKIEGFFDICRKRGLTGEQGVLIPTANCKHLMLRQDVVDAVAAGQFSVYPVETVEQGIELLTGLPAGERDTSGLFPEGTINRLVEDKLNAFADARRQFGSEGGKGNRDE